MRGLHGCLAGLGAGWRELAHKGPGAEDKGRACPCFSVSFRWENIFVFPCAFPIFFVFANAVLL